MVPVSIEWDDSGVAPQAPHFVSPAMSDPVDATTFRALMRRVPSPVVVVTARGPDEARGITIGSLSSTSLDPPLVCFNVGRDTQMFEVMEDCEEFAVNVLGEEQAHLAEHFARPDLTGSEQLESVRHARNARGTPILEGGSGVLRCVPHGSLPAGDHVLYVGLVVDVEMHPDRGAVIYYKSTYRGVGNELRSTRLDPVNRSSNDAS